uniref:hypothetical protein n=1 Tax=Actinotalea sp. TaxID=1872145 RepID=UPI0035618F66
QAGAAPQAGVAPHARAAAEAGAAGEAWPAVDADRATSSGSARQLGTVVGVDDPRRLVRLLHLLRATATHGEVRDLVVIDDVGGVLRALDAVPHGIGAELLVDLVRDASRLGIGVAAAGSPADLLRMVPHSAARLVLATADPHEDDVLGVPRSSPARSRPGLGVLLPGAELAQISCGPGGAAPDGAQRPSGPPVATAQGADALVLLPIPREVHLMPGAQTGLAGPLLLVLGRGGDAAGPVAIDAAHGVLVIGPRGSGRSTALATLRAGLAPEVEVRTLAELGERGDEPDLPGALRVWAAGTPGRVRVLVIDDLEVALRAAPALDDLLGAWVERAEVGADVPVLLASVGTERAAATFRGVVAELRRAAPVVVLGPGSPGSVEASGARASALLAAADPALPHHPGRGVLLHGGTATPVQVARPAGSGPSARRD